jgi:hypothetical protein
MAGYTDMAGNTEVKPEKKRTEKRTGKRTGKRHD